LVEPAPGAASPQTNHPWRPSAGCFCNSLLWRASWRPFHFTDHGLHAKTPDD